MAIDPATVVEQADHTLVDQYNVEMRSSDKNAVRIECKQVVRVLEAEVLITAASQSDGVLYDTLTVPEWAGRTDLVGRKVFRDRQVTGEIVSWDDAATVAVLSGGFELDPTNTGIALQRRNKVNAPSTRPARGHDAYEVRVSMETPEGEDYVKTLMFTAYFEAAKNLLGALGDTTYTDAQIQGAIMALGEDGISIDTFLSNQAEKIEEDRRAGLLPFAQVSGGAPGMPRA